MTHLIRRIPPRTVDRHFGRLFEQAFNDFLSPLENEDVATAAWTPAVDIRETEDALTLFAEIPGIAKDDVHLSVENDRLTISGERKFEKDTKEENYHRIERTYGAFTRSFALPKNVDTGKVKATFTDGVLMINLPKTEEAKPRQIEIS